VNSEQVRLRRRRVDAGIAFIAVALSAWLLRAQIAVLTMLGHAYFLDNAGWVSEAEHRWWLGQLTSICRRRDNVNPLPPR